MRLRAPSAIALQSTEGKTMRRIFLVLLVGLVCASLVAASPTFAGHRNTLCNQWADYYGNNEQVYLPLRWINWSDWYSHGDYIARRYNSAWDVTYQQWVPGYTSHSTTTSNGFDLYRASSIQRGGYTTVFGQVVQWSHTNC